MRTRCDSAGRAKAPAPLRLCVLCQARATPPSAFSMCSMLRIEHIHELPRRILSRQLEEDFLQSLSSGFR